MWPQGPVTDARPRMISGDRICLGKKFGTAKWFHADGTMAVKWDDGTDSIVPCDDVEKI